MKRISQSISAGNLLLLGLLFTSHPLPAQGPTFTRIDFPGATSTQAYGLSPNGDIGGAYTNPDNVAHGFLLAAGQYSTIDFPGASSTQVFMVGPHGELGGIYVLGGVTHGYLYSAGKFTTIDYPEASATAVDSINARGDILGDYTLGGLRHGFLYSGGKFTSFEYPGAANTAPVSINPQGDIAGGYNVSGVFHGFTLVDGEFTAIDYPGATRTGATGINARGDVVGRYIFDTVSHAFLWNSGQFTTIDFPGATFTAADMINQRGDIVGRYTLNGVSRAYLLANFRATCQATLPPSVIAAPALLSVSGDGRGPGAIQHADSYQLVSAANPAVSGEILTIYFTGLVTGAATLPQVTIGGKSADVLFAGNTPTYKDLNQANVRVPSGIAPGSAVPVRLTYLSRVANEVTIAVK